MSHKTHFQSSHQYGNYGNAHTHHSGKKVFRIDEIISQKNKRSASVNRSAIQLKVLAPMVK